MHAFINLLFLNRVEFHRYTKKWENIDWPSLQKAITFNLTARIKFTNIHYKSKQWKAARRPTNNQKRETTTTGWKQVVSEFIKKCLVFKPIPIWMTLFRRWKFWYCEAWIHQGSPKLKHYSEISVRREFRTGRFLYGENSVRRKFRTAINPRPKIPYFENSVRQKFHTAKNHTTKTSTAKTFTARILTAKFHAMKIYEGNFIVSSFC